jgi:hypothetical protein
MAINLPKEVAESICKLKQLPGDEFTIFVKWLADAADQKQHQLILAEAETMQVHQGECRSFMMIFNAMEGAEAARDAHNQGNH